MCSGKALGVIAAPVTLGASIVGGAIVKKVGGLLSGGSSEQPEAAATVVEETPTVDTTKSVYEQDVTAKAVAAAQTKEINAIKSRKGTGATVLTNPLGIKKAATVMKPTLGTSVSDEQKSNLLGL